ncbi:MAG: ComEC/Rec2 family competence protein [Deltaproteobacteria bacterium]|nr:ComEC/Rec2 family competence protein [Deltaproteobacteria bacterium]
MTAMAEGAQYAFSTDASRAIFVAEDPGAGGISGIFSRARRRTGDWVRRHAGTSDGAVFLLSLATGEVPAWSHPVAALLRSTGLAHLMAISGVNVAVFHVMAVFLLRVILWSVRMRHGTPDLGHLPAILSLPACWGYVLLAGAPVPAVRSAGMITLSVLAWRKAGVRAPGLAWSAMLFLTIAHAPLSILSPSLLLSYGATFFLIANFSVPSGGERSGSRGKILGWVRAAAIASTVAFFGTLPVSAAFFGTVPSGAILWNLLFGPILGTGGVAGASLAVLGGVFGIDAVGPLVRTFTEFLTFGLSTLDLVSASGAGCFPVPPSGVAAPLLATAAASAGTVWRMSRGRKPWIAPVAAGLLFLGWLHLPYAAMPEREFALTALNVGKGASHVVSFPGGGCFLIDCGSALRGDAGRRVVLPFLRGRGIRKIDALVLTHPHEDHFGGAGAVLSAMPVGEIWLPEGVPKEAFGPAVSSWRGHVREVRSGFTFESGGARVVVRAPRRGAGAGRANESGIIMEFRYGLLSVWLPGDVEEGPSSWGAAGRGEAERRVLFLPHHGSPGADPGGWAAFCRPSAVVAQNRNCFDGGNLLPSGQRFLLENGAFTVRSDGRKLTLEQGGRTGGWKILWRLT